MYKYSSNEEKELNIQLKKWQNRAKTLILNDYYDYISLDDIEYGVLTQLTNANTPYDISVYLWNSGMIERVLDNISSKLKEIRKK